VVVGIVLALLFAAMAVSGEAMSGAALGRILRTQINADILGTDPAGRRDENTDAVLLHMMEGLVAYREDGSVGPLLAESWEVSEDRRSYRFRLRESVPFHNGATLTAEDVVWSFRRYLDPATRWRCLPEVDGRIGMRIVSVQALDARTVRIDLDRPYPLFLQLIARPDCGEAAILHHDSVDADGRWRSPVGTGPYRLSQWRANQFVELASFPHYAARPEPRDGNTGGKRAHADMVRFLVIPDAAAAQAALLTGAIDVLSGLLPNMLGNFRHRPDVKITATTAMDSFAVLFQTEDPVLRDPLLRRAIAHAVDLDGLVEAVTFGRGRANPSVVPVGSAFHTPDHDRRFAPDLSRARQLVAESTYRGQKIKLTTTRRYPQLFDAAILLQAMARRAGIEFELEVVDWATELDRFQRGAYQAMAFAYSARLDPSFSYGALIGRKRLEPRKVWDDPEAAALLAESMAGEDRVGRQAAFDALHRRLLEQVPMLVLFNSVDIAATRANVDGFAVWRATQPRFWGVTVQ
jgi:peptide/nickel transport system substrate-binding protein